MAKKQELWRVFEDVVAEMHRQIDPTAQLTPNHKILGACGRMRQLDVTIAHASTSYNFLTIIECKHYKRRVSITEVEAFSRKMRDVRADKGVMIASSGFDAGAKAIAQVDGIVLRTLKDAKTTNWSSLDLSPSFVLIRCKPILQEAFMILQGSEVEIPIPLDTQLLEVEGGAPTTLEKEFLDWIPKGKLVTPCNFRSPVLVHPIPTRIDGVDYLIESFVVTGEVVAVRYDVPVTVVEGKALIDSDSDKVIYGNMITDGFDWREYLDSRTDDDGKLLTFEEWRSLMSGPHVGYLNDNVKRYIRVEATWTADNSRQ